MFQSKPIVPGGGGGRGSEQHVCKVILVISLSLSKAEQLLSYVLCIIYGIKEKIMELSSP